MKDKLENKCGHNKDLSDYMLWEATHKETKDN